MPIRPKKLPACFPTLLASRLPSLLFRPFFRLPRHGIGLNSRRSRFILQNVYIFADISEIIFGYIIDSRKGIYNGGRFGRYCGALYITWSVLPFLLRISSDNIYSFVFCVRNSFNNIERSIYSFWIDNGRRTFFADRYSLCLLLDNSSLSVFNIFCIDIFASLCYTVIEKGFTVNSCQTLIQLGIHLR